MGSVCLSFPVHHSASGHGPACTARVGRPLMDTALPGQEGEALPGRWSQAPPTDDQDWGPQHPCSLTVPLDHDILFYVAGEASEDPSSAGGGPPAPRPKLASEQALSRLAVDRFSAESFPFWGLQPNADHQGGRAEPGQVTQRGLMWAMGLCWHFRLAPCSSFSFATSLRRTPDLRGGWGGGKRSQPRHRQPPPKGVGAGASEGHQV